MHMQQRVQDTTTRTNATMLTTLDRHADSRCWGSNACKVDCLQDRLRVGTTACSPSDMLCSPPLG